MELRYFKEFSYEEIVEIAYGSKARGRVLSMTCQGNTINSILTPGKSVKVENKMQFSVCDTSNA